MNDDKLRIGCLYRVSTKMQVEKDDIPMQKTACHEFIARQPNWVLVEEYSEKGVSGYKLSASKRDVLQQVRADAEKKKFDVLLVFMFDRLGRREDETPFIVEWFHKKGIQVWSVKEGQQRFDSRVDKLLNYIRYWQSGGESEKTAIRVNEKHTQMVKEGLFRGGVAPYGYMLVKSGVINKKGKEICKLAINEVESKVVKMVYNLAYEQGYGGYRIAKYLNENGIKSRKGTNWGLSVTNYMLRNPIYKGYITYGKTTYKGDTQGRVSPRDWVLSEKPVDELIIIPEDIWDKVQKVRIFRTPECYRDGNIDYGNYPLQTKSPLLFVGLVKCGHCGSAITTTYHKTSWTKKDGTVKEWMKPVYRCSGRATGKVGCDGKCTYSKDVVEGIVLEEVYKYLDQLSRVDLADKIEKIKLGNMEEELKEIKRVKMKLVECNDEFSALNSEVSKSIMGKSSFKPDLLSKLIADKENEINSLKSFKEKLESIIESKKVEVDDMQKLQKTIPVWKEEFDKASLEKKKMMLSQIIDEIILKKDKVEINVKFYINEFITGIDEQELHEQKYRNGGFIGLAAGDKQGRDKK
jgi:Site-specific recombinases, DNA invertase Pin homologs